LDAPADGEDRQIRCKRSSNQRKLGPVARRIDLDCVVQDLLAVHIWIDIVAAGQQQTVDSGKQLARRRQQRVAVAVGEDVIARDTLTSTLDSATHGKKDERIFLRADKAVSYGDLMEVMNLLRNAGYLKIALVGLDGRS